MTPFEIAIARASRPALQAALTVVLYGLTAGDPTLDPENIDKTIRLFTAHLVDGTFDQIRKDCIAAFGMGGEGGTPWVC